jgi:DNA/RNA-binding domain of Phe-tRNA-synthetase-like protein
MRFSHHPAIWAQHPELSAAALFAGGIHDHAAAALRIAHHEALARERLAAGPESELPPIQAWRRTFQRMGLKPTQYRCAAEALLRRLRKDGEMPRLHPLVDLSNALSMAYAIPVAVLDVARIAGDLQVRHARGEERYLTFSGEVEQPDAGEVSFVDDAGNAHARRWTNRQSGLSAVRAETREVLVVIEAMHAGGAQQVQRLAGELAGELRALWNTAPVLQVLEAAQPVFEFSPAG